MSKAMEKAVSNHPVNEIEWIHFSELKANDYNPNRVAPPEMDLLKQSLLEDGWTIPIVIRPDKEIVDGFHRYLLVKDDEDIRALTSGFMPCTTLKLNGDRSHQMMATVRYNRARGTHYVVDMSKLVRALIDDHGMTHEDLKERLGMEEPEIERMYQRGKMAKRGSKDGYDKGWVPG